MADQAIHWLFPTPVIQADLTPTADVALAMDEHLALFDREVFSHPEFSDRNNLTGDLLGKAGLDQLHRLEAFQWPCAGRLMQAELSALEAALATPKRPVVAVVGGAKVSTKLELLGNLVAKVDYLVIGGGMANTFQAI